MKKHELFCYLRVTGTLVFVSFGASAGRAQPATSAPDRTEQAPQYTVELMLAPDADRPRVYFNIEFNVLGGILDNFRPNGPDKPRAPKWDADGVKIAGATVGTVNDDTDADRHWQVEVAIPWRNFSDYARTIPPRAATVMRINLNRSGGRTNRQYRQWASGGTPKPSFHTPDRFGRMVLSDRAALFGDSR